MTGEARSQSGLTHFRDSLSPALRSRQGRDTDSRSRNARKSPTPIRSCQNCSAIRTRNWSARNSGKSACSKMKRPAEPAFRELQKEGFHPLRGFAAPKQAGPRHEVEFVSNLYRRMAHKSSNATSATSPSGSGPRTHSWRPKTKLAITPNTWRRRSLTGPASCVKRSASWKRSPTAYP